MNPVIGGGNHGRDLDVVIVAYNSPADVMEALSRLPNNAHCVVVDHGNGSSARVADSLGAATVVDPTNPGFGSGQNLGVSKGCQELILILNPDARFREECLSAAFAQFDSDPLLAAVTGTILGTTSSGLERTGGVALSPLHVVGRAIRLGKLRRRAPFRLLTNRVRLIDDWLVRSVAEPVDVEALSATAMLVRRSAFEEVGGFDRNFFMYGEDADLSARLRRSGWKLRLMPETWAEHRDGSSFRRSIDRELRWFEGALMYGARWWRPTHYVATAMVVSAAAPVYTRTLPELVRWVRTLRPRIGKQVAARNPQI